MPCCRTHVCSLCANTTVCDPLELGAAELPDSADTIDCADHGVAETATARGRPDWRWCSDFARGCANTGAAGVDCRTGRRARTQPARWHRESGRTAEVGGCTSPDRSPSCRPTAALRTGSPRISRTWEVSASRSSSVASVSPYSGSKAITPSRAATLGTSRLWRNARDRRARRAAPTAPMPWWSAQRNCDGSSPIRLACSSLVLRFPKVYPCGHVHRAGVTVVRPSPGTRSR